MQEITKIGVIGAGQMGNGIAHVCALSGFDVYMVDVSPENLEKGLAAIKSNMDRQIQRKLISDDDAKAAQARITPGTDYKGFKDCQLVIEAATEKEDVKKAILIELCPFLNEAALVASNTSSISITRLGSYTDRPGKFVGMHFMNPVPRMELVELIRGIATDEDTFSCIRELTQKLGKKSISAEDFPAFIVNRILLPMINEAIYTLYEGV
ncbi:MAG: NAD(P)-binding domain-containing protein, partial [Rhodospirillales bacterium]|nr:NAD(P)-binding domain-containing protein [Rhodospirillales bacterium]